MWTPNKKQLQQHTNHYNVGNVTKIHHRGCTPPPYRLTATPSRVRVAATVTSHNTRLYVFIPTILAKTIALDGRPPHTESGTWRLNTHTHAHTHRQVHSSAAGTKGPLPKNPSLQPHTPAQTLSKVDGCAVVRQEVLYRRYSFRETIFEVFITGYSISRRYPVTMRPSFYGMIPNLCKVALVFQPFLQLKVTFMLLYVSQLKSFFCLKT